jgi:hypothetical protein
VQESTLVVGSLQRSLEQANHTLAEKDQCIEQLHHTISENNRDLETARDACQQAEVKVEQLHRDSVVANDEWSGRVSGL